MLVYLRDVKSGRNPSRNYGHFGPHVSLKLFFSVFLMLVDLLAQHSVYPIIDGNLLHIFTLFTALLHKVTFCAFSVQVLGCFIALFHIVTSRRFILYILTPTFTVAYCHSFPIA